MLDLPRGLEHLFSVPDLQGFRVELFELGNDLCDDVLDFAFVRFVGSRVADHCAPLHPLVLTCEQADYRPYEYVAGKVVPILSHVFVLLNLGELSIILEQKSKSQYRHCQMLKVSLTKRISSRVIVVASCSP